MSPRNEKGRSDGTGAIMNIPARIGGDIERILLRSLRNTGVSLLYQDSDLRVVWTQNVPSAWAPGDLYGMTDHDFLPETEALRLTTAKREVLATGNRDSLDIRIAGDEGARWFDVWIDADRGDDGAVVGVVTTAVETTEQKRREQTLRTLLREVSHRSKNLLAIIQSIATQTGRYSGTLEGFLGRFRGRLQSLASTQDLVTLSNWRGADLRELVIGQVGRYCADPARNIRLEGANPYLNPNAALHIGLALHELAVNSVSYGALSRPDGFVTICAALASAEAADALTLTWTETIAARDGALDEKKFGSVALERVVPASLNGTASFTADGDQLEYRLVIPSDNFEID
ncbi:Two-component sensor histidine kinase, contains HisKA and HATPase domains [Mesorhizobium albiziae]|uniref:histidine kinase n=2 Tax=Neomesorhizobium albiziae TaxID=335020 RepID=A0A1I3XBC2_9HYPH|nr:Two-component sensor histidine kinase, contains HisKA and HATPase domains [Mesorhizobium albiziae]